jgi:ABC-type uncharacterized transport system substrate-binding protein
VAGFMLECMAGFVGIRINREAIVNLAKRYRLPAIYRFRSFVTSGGLAAYASDTRDLWRRAADYADRILQGKSPDELPVQVPTRFQFVLNLRAAKAIGLHIPPGVLAAADDVIE